MGVPEVTVPPRELRADFEAVFERLRERGDLVWVVAGAQRFLLVNGADRAREVLVDRAEELVKPRSQAIDLGPPRPEPADGPIPVRAFRHALAGGLGSEREPEVLAAVAEAAARETAGWRDGDRIRVMQPLRRIGVRVACAGMLGAPVGDRDVDRAVHALRVLDEQPRVVSGGGAGRFTRAGLRRARAAARLAAVAAALVDRADLSRPGELTAVVRDLPALAPELGRAGQRRLVGELLLGAAGPLTQTAGWLLVRVANEPEAERAVRGEWDDVLDGGAGVGVELLPRLALTRAFVREVTRLHPTNPRITRAALVDTMVGGERVPARTRVVLNVNAINRDPRGYEEPLAFRPERWLDGRPTEHKLGYLSFGAGGRRCLGEGAGVAALTALLPALARRWRFRFEEVRVAETGRRQLADDALASLRAR